VFGSGDFGQLGLGEIMIIKYRPYPLILDIECTRDCSKDIINVNQAISGGMHTVVILEDDSVLSWGVNDEGALGRNINKDNDSYKPGRVELFSTIKVVQISAGDSHSCFLSETGKLYICGAFRNGTGVMGMNKANCILFTPVAIPQFCSTIFDKINKIVSGSNHILALTVRGDVYTWGSGDQGQLGRLIRSTPESMSIIFQLTPAKVKMPNWKSKKIQVNDVACGSYNSMILLSDGKVIACGLNNFGQLGLIKNNKIHTLTTITSCMEQLNEICGGEHHTMTLTRAGKVQCFGRPTYGRLGRNDVDPKKDEPKPQPVYTAALDESKLGAVQIAAGGSISSCISKCDGRGWLWGFGQTFMLGNGEDPSDSLNPNLIKESIMFNTKKIRQLTVGGQHTTILVYRRKKVIFCFRL
jgi:regulator of chromosome condensation